MFEILEKYSARKTKGILETQKTPDGKIVVFKNVKTIDDDDVQTITKTVVLTTTSSELQARLLEIQNEKQRINNFITAESIV